MKILNTIILLLIVSACFAQQYYTPTSKITAQGNSITSTTLESLIKTHQSVYSEKQIQELIRAVDANNAVVDAKKMELETQRVENNFEYRDFVRYATVKGDIEKLKTLEESLKELKTSIEKSLLNYSFKELYICVQPAGPFEEQSKLISNAIDYITPMAVESVNGTYINSITNSVDNIVVRDYIRSVKSGKVQASGSAKTKLLGASKMFLYLNEVEVSPLEGTLKTSSTYNSNTHNVLVLNVLSDYNYKQKLINHGVPQHAIDELTISIDTKIQNIKNHNNSQTIRQKGEIRNSNTKSEELEREINYLKSTINSKEESLRSFLSGIGVLYSSYSFDKSISAGKNYFAEKDKQLRNEITAVLEKRIEKKEKIPVTSTGSFARDIAKKAPELVKNMQEDYGKENLTMEVTEVENMVTTKYEAGSQKRITRTIDRVWLYPQTSDYGVYYVTILSSATISVGNGNGGGGYTPTTSNTFTDPRDGETYKIVTIGNQTWMAENLRYASGKYITGNDNWAALGDNNTDAAYCYYNDDKSNKQKYGALYTYAAAKNACPSGWHLPSDDEWTQLENYLIANGYNYDGSKSGDKTAKSLASKTGWKSSSETGDVGNNPDSNNKTGFSALAGGYRYTNGSFFNMGKEANFWSSTAFSSRDAWYRNLNGYHERLLRYSNYKSYGFSVRCVRD